VLGEQSYLFYECSVTTVLEPLCYTVALSERRVLLKQRRIHNRVKGKLLRTITQVSSFYVPLSCDKGKGILKDSIVETTAICADCA
jgi:hypothetical protein